MIVPEAWLQVSAAHPAPHGILGPCSPDGYAVRAKERAQMGLTVTIATVVGSAAGIISATLGVLQLIKRR